LDFHSDFRIRVVQRGKVSRMLVKLAGGRETLARFVRRDSQHLSKNIKLSDEAIRVRW